LGPGVGYLIGGAFLKAYVDFDTVDISTWVHFRLIPSATGTFRTWFL